MANRDSEIKRVGRFGLVGILNTAIDFGLFNLLRLLLPTLLATIISGTAAMINSYIFNQRFTFKAKQVSPRQTVTFFGVTIAGLYLFRPAIVYFLTKTWLWPSDVAFTISNKLALPFTLSFVRDNLAFVVGIAFILCYNYLSYKKFVFTKK
jgi:putative flippase GtrA